MLQGESRQADFSRGPVWKSILSMAIPMTVAQIVSLLYNIIDRMYIGHLPNQSTLPLTALGLTFPVITLITAITNLFGMGGAPLCSIARGSKDHERAEQVIGNTFALLSLASLVLTAVLLIFRRPILIFLGAGEDTYSYANEYLSIYLLGSFFSMTALGMNGFINAQGFGRRGMTTIVIGAAANAVLDPLFIFVFGMGVRGAAIATVISQALSALFVLRFLTGPLSPYRLRLSRIRISLRLSGQITAMGSAACIMAATNGINQAACNAALKYSGGDLYIAVMTALSSIRDISWLVVQGIGQGAQPVLGFNYGSKLYSRVRQGIRFMTSAGILYSTLTWLIIMIFPSVFLHIFSTDPELIEAGVPALRIYFFCFFMMSLQFAGQTAFTALGYPSYAIVFSILRKVIIVVPLTLLLPLALGVNGVFIAEPISNLIGGLACFLTMYFLVYRRLGKVQT